MIKDYHDKPSFKLRGKSVSKLFLGVELEVEPRREYDAEDLSDEVDDCLGNFAICKHDSSIPHGFEICSSPASLEYHRTKWDGFFKDLSPKLKAFKPQGCGMHVHVSRAPLTTLQVGKMLVFVYSPENYTFIKRIAQRDSSYQNNFKEKRELADAQPKKVNKDKHTAINLLHNNTIEIRIFKSNLRKDMFMKNLEFCHALAKFTWAGQVSVDDCKHWRYFAKFVKNNKDTYPNLYKYLVQYRYLRRRFNPNEKVEEKIEGLTGDKEAIYDFDKRIREKVKKTFEDSPTEDWNKKVQDIANLYDQSDDKGKISITTYLNELKAKKLSEL